MKKLQYRICRHNINCTYYSWMRTISLPWSNTSHSLTSLGCRRVFITSTSFIISAFWDARHFIFLAAHCRCVLFSVTRNTEPNFPLQQQNNNINLKNSMIHKNTVKFYKKRLVKVLALSWYLQVWSYAMTNKHPLLQQFTQVAIYVQIGMWITYFPNSSLRSYISSILLSLVMITLWSRKASVITKKR